MMSSTEARVQRLERILEISRELTSALALEPLLKKVLATAAELTDCEAASILLLDARSGELRFVMAFGAGAEKVMEADIPVPIESSIAGAILTSREPLIVLDVQADPRLYREVDRRTGFIARSLLGVPLQVRDRCIGVLEAVNKRGGQGLSQEDVETLTALAASAAIAIQNAQLYEALQQRNRELVLLNQAGQTFNSIPEPDQVLATVLEETRRLMVVTTCSVWLIDPETDELVCRQAAGPQKGAVRGWRLAPGEGIAGWTVRHGENVIVPDTRADKRYLGGLEQQTGLVIRSVLSVPLRVRETTIGVLQVMDTATGRFDPGDLALLEPLAASAAIAIENALLHEVEQRRRSEAEALYRAAQVLTTTLGLSQVFERVLGALQLVVPYDTASVQLLREERLEIIGGHGFLNLDEVLGITFDLSEEEDIPNREVMRRRVPFIVDDAPAVYPTFREEPHVVTGIRSWLGVPLLFGDRAIGMLTLDKQEIGFYTSEHAHMASAFAAQAAIAIENARLYEEVRDYAERLEERVRERTAELQARNEELVAYDHTVAHDLKNPLALVIGYAELLEADSAEMSAEELQKYLRTVARSGRKMRNIIDELLLLSGVRDMEVEMAPLDMMAIVAEVQQRLASMVEERQAEVALPDTWPVALGYGPWVEEVWVNYLSNALKYGGRPPRVELGATEQAGATVRFWVSDNGPGLTPEEQARLFRPFTRLGRDRAKGHGLGLSIVQRIVEKLGGRVGVESKVGQGSIFFFTLPMAK